MRGLGLWAAVAAGCSIGGVSVAAGQEVEVAAASQITVTATRTARRLDEVPATVSVITAEDIEEALATDIKDLIRFEPGLAVPTSPTRFTAALSATGRDGNSGFNIRGLEGNRVLIRVDGVRVPDGFSFGAQAVGRGDYVDLDLVKSVEILRGPASALYGSDGVAGAVSFITKDPEDFLAGENSFGGRVRVAYASADESRAEGIIGAGRADKLSGLVAYTRRDGHEQETRGTNDAPNITRTEANPQDIESNAVLARLVLAASAEHTLRLTYEHYDRKTATEVLSAGAVPPFAATSTLDLDALDKLDRDRISLDHRYAGEGLIERGFWSLDYQTSTTREFSAEDRNTAADRLRINTFDNDVWSLTGQAESSFAFAGMQNHLVYGGDFSMTHQTGVRDGSVPPVGETFPTRAFPNTDFALAGVFLQDEISLANGGLTLYPAIRYDWYDLDPKPDALFVGTAAGQSDSHISPKLGLVWWPFRQFGLFANATKGFKAPSPSQVNNGFTNVVLNYRSDPNPNLAPETSEAIEGGLRMRDTKLVGATWSAGLTGFAGRYKDFIEQVQVSGNFTPGDPAIFQYVNLTEVTISGAEARIDGVWQSGFGVIAAFSTAHGDSKSGGASTPLASIEPWKLVAGAMFRDPGGRFGGQLAVTHSGKKALGRTGIVCTPSCYTPDAFTVADLTAYWNAAPSVALRLGIFNLTDETYAWWSDVRGLSSASTVLDAYTQPGRNFGASLSYRF